MDYPTNDIDILRLSIAEKFGLLKEGDTGEVREFQAIALTDGVPLSRLKQLAYGGSEMETAAAAGRIGRYILKLGERIIQRLPIIRSVYGALKQIFESVLASSSESFREVVLVEYPRRGIWAIAFITGTTKEEVQNITDNEMVNIFLPTTPNPTSGFLLFVSRDELIQLNMTVEEGIKMVISGGIVTPKDKNAKKRIKVKTREAEIKLLKDVEKSINRIKDGKK